MLCTPCGSPVNETEYRPSAFSVPLAVKGGRPLVCVRYVVTVTFTLPVGAHSPAHIILPLTRVVIP